MSDPKEPTAVDALSRMFDMQTYLFANVVRGISDEHAHVRPNATTNHIAWITGHLVSARFMLCNVLGANVAEPFPELFADLKGMEVNASYPTMEALTKDWSAVSGTLMERLRGMSVEELFAPASFPFPNGNRRVDQITFVAHHEAYTIGQIGLLRRYFGYPAMSYARLSDE